MRRGPRRLILLGRDDVSEGAEGLGAIAAAGVGPEFQEGLFVGFGRTVCAA